MKNWLLPILALTLFTLGCSAPPPDKADFVVTQIVSELQRGRYDEPKHDDLPPIDTIAQINVCHPQWSGLKTSCDKLTVMVEPVCVNIPGLNRRLTQEEARTLGLYELSPYQNTCNAVVAASRSWVDMGKLNSHTLMTHLDNQSALEQYLSEHYELANDTFSLSSIEHKLNSDEQSLLATHQKRLERDVQSLDMASICKTISKMAPLPAKGEFETSVEHRQRITALAQRSLGKLDGLYAITVNVDDKIQYDADHAQYRLSEYHIEPAQKFSIPGDDKSHVFSYYDRLGRDQIGIEKRDTYCTLSPASTTPYRPWSLNNTHYFGLAPSTVEVVIPLSRDKARQIRNKTLIYTYRVAQHNPIIHDFSVRESRDPGLRYGETYYGLRTVPQYLYVAFDGQLMKVISLAQSHIQ